MLPAWSPLQDPWLASIAADGSLAILGTDAPCTSTARLLGSMRGALGGSNSGAGPAGSRGGGGGGSAGRGVGYARQLQAGHGCTYTIDLREQWLVAGGAQPRMQVWDFRGAAAHEERAAAAKVRGVHDQLNVFDVRGAWLATAAPCCKLL